MFFFNFFKFSNFNTNNDIDMDFIFYKANISRIIYEDNKNIKNEILNQNDSKNN